MNPTTTKPAAVTPPAAPNFEAERAAAARVPAEFTFSGHEVRIVERNGEPWFVAADVLDTLTLDRKALERIDEDEKGVSSVHTLGGEQRMTVVSESGLYALVLRSRKPEARKFAKWVTSEVLPSIRKTGAYVRQEYSVDPHQALTAPEAETLRLMLTNAAERVPKAKRGALMMQGWSKLKAHFHCSYRDIPRHEFSEAVSILSRHAAEWEVVDNLPALAPQDHDQMIELMKMSGQIAEEFRQQVFESLIREGKFDDGFERWIITRGVAGQPTRVGRLPMGAVTGTPEELANIVREGGWGADAIAMMAKASMDYLAERATRRRGA